MEAERKKKVVRCIIVCGLVTFVLAVCLPYSARTAGRITQPQSVPVSTSLSAVGDNIRLHQVHALYSSQKLRIINYRTVDSFATDCKLDC